MRLFQGQGLGPSSCLGCRARARSGMSGRERKAGYEAAHLAHTTRVGDGGCRNVGSGEGGGMAAPMCRSCHGWHGPVRSRLNAIGWSKGLLKRAGGK
jgi:hypothetical protein